MPRTSTSTAAADNTDITEKPTESEKPIESEERLNLNEDNDAEEAVEEEVEYEEVEEEVEEEIEEEVEEEEEDEEAADGADIQKQSGRDEEMEVADIDKEDERKKHAELLSLPPHGSEVYLGGIPYDASEEELRGFCESIGEVTEVRIMRGNSGEAKGYAFVTFRTKEFASKAIEQLNNSELKGKKVRCSTSQAKHRLFIGNVPRNWSEDDMKKAVMQIGPGVISVELLKDPQNSIRNRGFAFIEYYNPACAEYSRQKMSNPKFKLDDNAPTVSWADPKNAESSASSQVKALYVKNLPKDITQDHLKELFERHGKITKVAIPPAKAGHERSRFGFVHFAERSSAMKALKNTEKYEIDGQVLECSLAKPQGDQRSSGGPNLQKTALHPGYPPHLGYGMVGGAYNALGAGYFPTGFAQPMMYGRGSTPAGMAMLPMLLPDGRIGYVLQQSGVQQHTPPPPRSGRGGSGSSSSGGRRGGDNSRGHSRYSPY